ncbi:uncharacterized protein MELLADRAFT_74658 [Melampsora larici-populina 98AG31]|uniref:Uncharacterized protein n=1 Tax=Melampsora larici-populina (strain 98AG31 / pathotype 3-4-7) TaxID=747676 RepID=F4RIY6_MELLP|nr:uncharacterized protein MELLADRAFT_74658 [Melampsora larici-populina 98AG31]EGG07642.1 hypothetical protein MELLADRAFT_74658 [Melampsora larici-populina 98AG31]
MRSRTTLRSKVAQARVLQLDYRLRLLKVSFHQVNVPDANCDMTHPMPSIIENKSVPYLIQSTPFCYLTNWTYCHRVFVRYVAFCSKPIMT